MLRFRYMNKTSKLFLFFIIWFWFTDSYGQQLASNLQKYFPEPVIPAIWYESMNILPDTYRNYYKNQEKYTKIYFSGGYYELPTQISHFSDNVHKQIITSGMMNSILKDENFNPYSVSYNFAPKTYFMPASMMILRKEAEYDDLRPEKHDFLKQKNFDNIFLPKSEIFDNAISTFQERPHSSEMLVRNLSRNNPQLVDYLWNEVPDAPKIKRRNTNKNQETIQAMLDEVISRQPVILPNNLRKVEVETPKWKYSGSEHLTFAQTYIKNWVQGGESSQSLQSDLKVSANYSYENVTWKNELRHRVGLLSYKLIEHDAETETTKERSHTRINEDVLELKSQYGYKASKHWDYGLLFKLYTQLFKGFPEGDIAKEEPISAFFSPGYITLAAGMNLKAGKNNNFTLLLAPVTGEITMVLNDDVDKTLFSIDADKSTKFDVGASLTNTFQLQIDKDFKIMSSAYLFYDYFDKENKIKSYWDLIAEMRINVFLSVRITANFRYYENELHKLQTKQNMGLSFRYIF